MAKEQETKDKAAIDGAMRDLKSVGDFISPISRFMGTGFGSLESARNEVLGYLIDDWYDTIRNKLSRHSQIKRILSYDFRYGHKMDVAYVLCFLAGFMKEKGYRASEVVLFADEWNNGFIDEQFDKLGIDIACDNDVRDLKKDFPDDIIYLSERNIEAAVMVVFLRPKPTPRADSVKWKFLDKPYFLKKTNSGS
jgi:hypothetical protein